MSWAGLRKWSPWRNFCEKKFSVLKNKRLEKGGGHPLPAEFTTRGLWRFCRFAAISGENSVPF